ncbi:MAG TPA: hypothetical protein VGC70_01985 [Burkholderiales bacterium]
MDRALWITWYDLPEAGREDYLSWLHTSYIPRVLEHPGVMWAAHYASEHSVIPLGGGKGRIRHSADSGIPSGDRYILLFGARDARPFANPSPNEFHATLAESDRRMLERRLGERVNIMLEESRVLGPEGRNQMPAVPPSACIQLGSFNSGSYRDEDEIARWYAQWRLPSMQSVPGCVRVRTLVSVAGWAKYACLYEFTSLSARNEHFIHYERDRPDMEAWSKQVVKNLAHAPGSPNVAQRIWLAEGRQTSTGTP